MRVIGVVGHWPTGGRGTLTAIWGNLHNAPYLHEAATPRLLLQRPIVHPIRVFHHAGVILPRQDLYGARPCGMHMCDLYLHSVGRSGRSTRNFYMAGTNNLQRHCCRWTCGAAEPMVHAAPGLLRGGPGTAGRHGAQHAVVEHGHRGARPRAWRAAEARVGAAPLLLRLRPLVLPVHAGLVAPVGAAVRARRRHRAADLLARAARDLLLGTPYGRPVLAVKSSLVALGRHRRVAPEPFVLAAPVPLLGRHLSSARAADAGVLQHP